MRKVQKVLTVLTNISGIFVILCYSVYLLSCLIQESYYTIIIPLSVIAAASAAMLIKKEKRILLKSILCAGMCFYMLTFSAFSVYIYSRPETGLDADESYVLAVFGCRTYGMTPGRTLKSRLDRAYDILAADQSMTCIVSGGQGPNETVAEAIAMRWYLMTRGINSGRIITEENSGNTAENILNIRRILAGKNLLNNTVIGVSSVYHLPRINMLAKKQNLKIITMSADVTDIFFTFSDTVREYMAWIKAIAVNI